MFLVQRYEKGEKWMGQTNKGKKVKRVLTPHALKGQKLIAQGNTLGNVSKNKVAL